MNLRLALPLALTFAALAWAASQSGRGELPPDAETAVARLNQSPRHGEWVEISEGRSDSWGDKVHAWVTYPERATRAPTVIVIHEIYGLTDWVRSVADQLAAEGFIAIAPDLLSGYGPDGRTPTDPQAAVKLIRERRTEDVVRRLTSVARYATSLPASNGKYGSIGFCWGGLTSFQFAGNEDQLSAAVVYYGTSPDRKTLGRIQAPVLGLYGADDARVNATIPDAARVMRQLGKPFTPHLFDGAGHAFLRQQDARDGANMAAATQAWPLTINFLRENLETR
jgi:carboxymethylenebutenolidase